MNLAHCKKEPLDVKPVTAVVSQTVAAVNIKPVVTSAIVTKMETTAVSRPEMVLQAVPIITGLNLAQKDTTVQKISVKSIPVVDNLKSKLAVSILDFADMGRPEGQRETSKQLPSQHPATSKQQSTSLLNKTPLPQEKPREPTAREQSLTHLPSSVITTMVSLPSHSSSISTAWTQPAMTSPPKVVRSSAAVIPNTGHSAVLAASVANLGTAVLPNSFIALTSSSFRHLQPQQQQQQQQASVAEMRQQQQHQHPKPAADLASAIRRQQQHLQQAQSQQPVVSAPPSPQTILDSITSPRRYSVCGILNDSGSLLKLSKSTMPSSHPEYEGTSLLYM